MPPHAAPYYPVGERLLRELSSAEVPAAVLDVERWGFPRSVADYEALTGHWFRLGPGVVFWFEAFDAERPIWCVHLCVDPQHRRTWPVRAWVRSYRQIARRLGIRRLHALPIHSDGEVASYLSRLGWEAGDLGFSMEVN